MPVVVAAFGDDAGTCVAGPDWQIEHFLRWVKGGHIALR
jgi:hypothetical protein